MKKRWITLIIILIIILLSVLILSLKKHPGTTKEIAECIGTNSVLYTQLGCHACEIQKEMFGNNYQYLNIVDCWFEQEKCSEIIGTPTWKIKGKLYKGVQSIDKLKELTNCD